MFCHKALTTRLLGKIERFLFQFKKVSSVAHALGEELEKFLRFEVGCEERAKTTIFFSATTRRALEVAGERREDNQEGHASKEGWGERGMEQGKGLGRVQHTVAA